LDFNLFEGNEFRSFFTAMEKSRHEVLTEKMKIYYYEMRKLPEKQNKPDKMEMWLRFLRAESQEELDIIQKTGGKIMAKAVNEYSRITASPEYLELERRKRIARIDEKLITLGAEERGKKEILDLLKSGLSPEEILKKYKTQL